MDPENNPYLQGLPLNEQIIEATAARDELIELEGKALKDGNAMAVYVIRGGILLGTLELLYLMMKFQVEP